MKQARRWLLLTAALVLLPSSAFAQKPGAGKKPADTKPAAAEEQKPAEPAPEPGAGEEKKPPEGAGGDLDICAATPDAPECQGGPKKPVNLAEEAKKQAQAEIYAVQQIYALKYHRFEINPYWAFSLNDQFVSHPGPGLALNYYITNVLAVGVNGNWYGGLNVDSDFNFQNRRAARVAVPLNEYQWAAALNFTYVPMYGKFSSSFGSFIFQWESYVVGGVGAISTRPIPVIDPDNRNFSFKPKVDFNAGLGIRVFLNRWLAATVEIRDYIYNEQLEALTVAPTQQQQQDQGTWFGENRLTNNVQAQLGVSIFLPFSWEYRLPK